MKLLLEKLYEKSNIMKPMNFAKLDEVLLRERIWGLVELVWQLQIFGGIITI